MTLVEWLTSILDEDERVARAASLDEVIEEAAFAASEVYRNGGFHDRKALWPLIVRATIPALHSIPADPAAVLADIAAKRRLLNLCAEWTAMARSTPGSAWYLLGNADKVCRLLASGYAHRDGFDPSWA